MKTKIILALIVFVSLPAMASQYSCLQQDRILDSQSVFSVSACQVKQPLQLVPTQGTGGFRYWIGSYAKQVKEQTTYLVVVDDICVHQRVSEKYENEISQYVVEFNIKNPNLSDDAPSYEQAPMTDAEAATAFAKVQAQCESNEH